MIMAVVMMNVVMRRAYTAHEYLKELGGDSGGDTIAHNDPIGLLVT